MPAGWTHSLVFQGETLALGEGELTVGRSRTCDVTINDPSVSRKHVILIPGDGHILIRDLGSSNGTFIDDRRVQAEDVLEHGNVLRMGDAEVHVRVLPGQDTAATAGRPQPGEATFFLQAASMELADAMGAESADLSIMGAPAPAPQASPPGAPMPGAPHPSSMPIPPPASPSAMPIPPPASPSAMPIPPPAAPQPAAPQSAAPQPATPQPATPEPVAPQPAAAPEPAAPAGLETQRMNVAQLGLSDQPASPPSPPSPPAPSASQWTLEAEPAAPPASLETQPPFDLESFPQDQPSQPAAGNATQRMSLEDLSAAAAAPPSPAPAAPTGQATTQRLTPEALSALQNPADASPPAPAPAGSATQRFDIQALGLGGPSPTSETPEQPPATTQYVPTQTPATPPAPSP